MSNKVKELQGVNIYLNKDGLFYSDLSGNSSEFRDANVKSDKLKSVEKAIKEFTSSEYIGSKYYILGYCCYLKELTVVGGRLNYLVFNDGTNSTMYRNLVEESELNMEEYNYANEISKEYSSITVEIRELHLKNVALREEFRTLNLRK